MTGRINGEGHKVINVMRSNTPNDPLVKITETVKVINGIALLKEFPDVDGELIVKDSANNPLTEKPFATSEVAHLSINEFCVDYTNGLVYFADVNTGKFFTINYLGMGMYFFPASRVWTKETGGLVTETLEEQVGNQISEFQNRVNNIVAASSNNFPEIADSRNSAKYGTFATLKTRLDAMDDKTEEKETPIGAQTKANKALTDAKFYTDANFIKKIQVNSVNGVAGLDENGKINPSQLPLANSTNYGMVKLSDVISSPSSSIAATTKAIYDSIQEYKNYVDLKFATIDSIKSFVNKDYVDGQFSTINQSLAGKLDLSGGTLTGDLTLKGSPTSPLHPATKQYVDQLSQISNVVKVVDVVWNATLSTGNSSISMTEKTITLFEPLIQINEYQLKNGDRILVNNRFGSNYCGIYVYESPTLLRRSKDADTPAKFKTGTIIYSYYNQLGKRSESNFYYVYGDHKGDESEFVTYVKLKKLVPQDIVSGDFNALSLIDNKDGLNYKEINLKELNTQGTYTKVTTDKYGRVTKGDYLKPSDTPYMLLKEPCRLLIDQNLSTSSVDGNTLNLSSPLTKFNEIDIKVNDRLLINGQDNKSENGIYVYINSTTLKRSPDFNMIGTELSTGLNGSMTVVTEGIHAGQLYVFYHSVSSSDIKFNYMFDIKKGEIPLSALNSLYNKPNGIARLDENGFVVNADGTYPSGSGSGGGWSPIDGSDKNKGIVKLSDDITSTSDVKAFTAATPLAVKKVNDLITNLSSTIIPLSQKGFANGVAELDSNSKVVTSQLPNASTSNSGIVQLSDDITSNSTNQAATINAVKQVDEKSKKYADDNFINKNQIGVANGVARYEAVQDLNNRILELSKLSDRINDLEILNWL